MKIILREDVESVGVAGETVTVKDGFARNYLIPKKLAYPATRSYSKVFDEEKKLKMLPKQKKPQLRTPMLSLSKHQKRPLILTNQKKKNLRTLSKQADKRKRVFA